MSDRDPPSLCDSDECVGCGTTKTYRGKPAGGLVCCGACWKRLPKWMRWAFVTHNERNPSRPHGPTIWEECIALCLQWMKEVNQ